MGEEPPMKLVMIKWVDSFNRATGWINTPNWKVGEPCTVTTVGWIVAEGNDAMDVAQSMSPETELRHEQVHNVISIPMGAILNIRPIAASEARTKSKKPPT
jgi:hypothetical protein